jgi:hypothetical protein
MFGARGSGGLFFRRHNPAHLDEPAHQTCSRALAFLYRQAHRLYRRRRVSRLEFLSIWGAVNHAAFAAERLTWAARRGWCWPQLARVRRN